MIGACFTKISDFLRSDSGATSIEYAVMAAGIAVAVVVTIQQLGDPVDGLIGKVYTAWVAAFGG